MMLFFSILSILVLINGLLLIFSTNKTNKIETKKSIVYQNGTSMQAHTNETEDHEMAYKKAV